MTSVLYMLAEASAEKGLQKESVLGGALLAGGALAAGTAPLMSDTRHILHRWGASPRAAGLAAGAVGAMTVGSTFSSARQAGKEGKHPSFGADDVVSPLREGLLLALFASGASGLSPSSPQFRKIFATTAAISGGASALRRIGAKGVQQEAYDRNWSPPSPQAGIRKAAADAVGSRSTTTSMTSGASASRGPQGYGRMREGGFGADRTRGFRALPGFAGAPAIRSGRAPGDPSPLTQMGGVGGAIRSAASGQYGLRLQPAAPKTQTSMAPTAAPRVIMPPNPAGKLPSPQKPTGITPVKGVAGVNPPEPPKAPKAPKLAEVLLKSSAGNNMFNHGPTRSYFSGLKNFATMPLRMIPKPVMAAGALGGTLYGLERAGKPMRSAAADAYHNTPTKARARDMYSNWWTGAGGTRPLMSSRGHSGPGPADLTPG